MRPISSLRSTRSTSLTYETPLRTGVNDPRTIHIAIFQFSAIKRRHSCPTLLRLLHALRVVRSVQSAVFHHICCTAPPLPIIMHNGRLLHDHGVRHLGFLSPPPLAPPPHPSLRTTRIVPGDVFARPPATIATFDRKYKFLLTAGTRAILSRGGHHRTPTSSY